MVGRYRFGLAERMLICVWMMMAAALISTGLITAYPGQAADIQPAIDVWLYLTVFVGLLPVGLPGFRDVYWEHVAPRLPNFKNTI